jgi:flagellar motor protein MotB
MRYAAKHDSNKQGWAISLADLMGLLVSFFVMLTVLLTQDSDKFNDIATSMRKAFKADGKSEVVVLIPPVPLDVDKKLEQLLKAALKKDPRFVNLADNLVISRGDDKLSIELPLKD